MTGRTLIVLAVAAVVSGIFYYGAQSTGLLSEGSPPADFAQIQAPAVGDATGEAAGEIRGPGGHGEQQGVSLAAATEILKDIVVIGIIVFAVAVVQGLYGRLVGKRTQREVAAGAP
jgi:hypothetical protein